MTAKILVEAAVIWGLLDWAILFWWARFAAQLNTDGTRQNNVLTYLLAVTC